MTEPEVTVAQPIHFYMPAGQTFAQRILCQQPDKGVNTHVTEYGNQVTCPTCRELLIRVDQHREDT